MERTDIDKGILKTYLKSLPHNKNRKFIDITHIEIIDDRIYFAIHYKDDDSFYPMTQFNNYIEVNTYNNLLTDKNISNSIGVIYLAQQIFGGKSI